MSYHQAHAESASSWLNLAGKNVLIVGANTGEDCAYFVERGAASVCGVDVIAEVGVNFRGPRVTYLQESVEAMSLESESFDLVYSVATMEHVRNIEAGFAEMARVLRPGGVIYSLAAPLWKSPAGHHMGCFQDFPWIHLVMGTEGLVRFGQEHGIRGEGQMTLETTARYMLDPGNFNRRNASEYVRACAGLPDLTVKVNRIFFEKARLLEHPNGQQALRLGHAREDLLGTAHRFIARKPRHRLRTWARRFLAR